MLSKFNFNYMSHYENAKRIRTDDPINEIWNTILRLCDISYLEQRWKNHTIEDLIFVSNSIKQAYEYYQASKGLSLKTKPLLLYYSTLNLSKAALFILADIKPSGYHGLCNESVSKTIEDMYTILGFSAETNNGVFLQLGKQIGYEMKVKEKLTIEYLCDNILELNYEYAEYFNRKPKFITPKVIGNSEGYLQINFNEPQSNEIKNIQEKNIYLKNMFESFQIIKDEPSYILKYQMKETNGETSSFHKEASNVLSKIFQFSVVPKDIYYLNLNSNPIPMEMAYFALIHILCSIVRYKPDSLYFILDKSETSINWFINKFCNLCERVYPNLMLNLIYSTNFKYASSYS